MLRKLLVSLVVLSAGPALGQGICPVSNAVGVPNIGDGCSTQGAEYVPHIGIFRSTFTPSCDLHDKCYTQLGADYDGCDSAFYDDMRNRCDSKYNKILRPAEWSMCRTTAFEYYQAVKALGANANERRFMQNEARNRSVVLFSNVDNDVCGTTPERTTLYAPVLISQITARTSHTRVACRRCTSCRPGES